MKYQYSFLLGFLASLAFACDPEGDYHNYEDWDSDADEVITNEEFYDGITATGYHANWDLNSDETVTDEEMLLGFYRIWDTDGDQIIDQAEWEANMPEKADEFTDMDQWDQDGQEGLSFDEFAETMAGTEFYERLDANLDDEISDEELSNSLYYLWDNDDDGYVELTEYEEWYDKYYNSSLN